MTAALIAKLESASEGSRELDCKLTCLLDDVYCGPNQTERHTTEADENESYHMLPAPSRSIDTALWLTEQVLGRGYFGVTLDIDEHGGSRCVLEYQHASRVGTANTPALAICAALLRASAAEGAAE